MRFIYISFFVLVNSSTFSQDMKEYLRLTFRADSLYKEKKYKDAVIIYYQAFQTINDQGKVKDRYSAAICWALLKNADSAFSQLTRIVVKGKYSAYFQITQDENLKTLHQDPRWEPLLKKVEENVYIKSAELNATIQPLQPN